MRHPLYPNLPMRTEAEQLLLDLVAQIMVAPRHARDSSAFEDAMNYFAEDDVDEVVQMMVTTESDFDDED